MWWICLISCQLFCTVSHDLFNCITIFLPLQPAQETYWYASDLFFCAHSVAISSISSNWIKGIWSMQTLRLCFNRCLYVGWKTIYFLCRSAQCHNTYVSRPLTKLFNELTFMFKHLNRVGSSNTLNFIYWNTARNSLLQNGTLSPIKPYS